jgi:hypothetical protein
MGKPLCLTEVERGSCFAGIRSERVEALGRAELYNLDACDRLGTRDERAGGSAVYPSFARLGASRPSQRVQVETALRAVGQALLPPMDA